MIKINNLTKKFAETEIFNDTSYTFRNHGIVCLLGPSGSGKSTLLNMIAGFDTKYEGEILVNNEKLKDKNDNELSAYRKNNIGFIFQNYNLLKGFSSSENMLLASEKCKDDAINLLEKMGIKEKADEKIENLSGGQKQRVAIARALIDSPNIILADEPTGALDRTTSNEIMSILKQISKERLVIIITHDKKICEFADEIIEIEDGKIVTNSENSNEIIEFSESLTQKSTSSKKLKNQAIKNIKVNIARYVAVALSVSIGIIAFMLSLSSGNLVDSYIEDFKAENTVFSNGYIKNGDSKVYDLLSQNAAIERVYYQYKLNDIDLIFGDKTEHMNEKFPTSKSTEELSYGSMPLENEIAITPSLAKKLNDDISSLIGKKLLLIHSGQEYSLTISGVYNASYDDFIVDFDTEQELYNSISNEEVYSVSYDVFEFLDVMTINTLLLENGYSPLNSAKEIETIQSTFDGIEKIFLIISSITLIIGIFISALLLSKLQTSRYHEIGLLSALGFEKGEIKEMINHESLYISLFSSAISGALLMIIIVLNTLFEFGFSVSALQILMNFAIIFIAVMLLCRIFSNKLINTEPAEALKK